MDINSRGYILLRKCINTADVVDNKQKTCSNQLKIKVKPLQDQQDDGTDFWKEAPISCGCYGSKYDLRFCRFNWKISFPFLKKKLDNNGNKFNYRELKWLMFNKVLGVFHYKNVLTEDTEFFIMDINKKTKVKCGIKPKLIYDKSLPVSKKKKTNLLSLLPQVDADVREFYEQLCTTDDPRDIDPDLDRINSDIDEDDM